MKGFVYQLVARLADPDAKLSRNRQFALFASPAGRRALRLHRHLSSLAQDLAKHRSEAKLDVEDRPDDALEVRVTIPSLSVTRTAFLSRDDLRVLEKSGGELWEALRPARSTPGR